MKDHYTPEKTDLPTDDRLNKLIADIQSCQLTIEDRQRYLEGSIKEIYDKNRQIGKVKIKDVSFTEKVN